ncbi:hypothetical protein EDB81DRAFT_862092 [Dactylonectria macrodidyma]|uniref:Uncharacterized protein n=1 Tax=Dactylonectria macrodidyma TaxID=307937 RepID=A0A9P9DBW2_9HYPO|nr:hypothetical protein EDB81DRAFT_862092 [Dactylonectria macrodidyma]
MSKSVSSTEFLNESVIVHPAAPKTPASSAQKDHTTLTITMAPSHQTSGVHDVAAHPHVVLGIPVPREVQELPITPPICLPTTRDITPIDLARRFGTDRGINEKEITQACSLASGGPDMVILLERPCAKTYDTTFDQFVKDSDTLRAV